MAKTGFVSGAGAHGFRFDGPGDTQFSLTAVLVEEGHEREVGEGFLRIRRRHFPDGKFAAGDGRGIVQTRRFLKALQELDFSFHSRWWTSASCTRSRRSSTGAPFTSSSRA
ncbi:hypothetical protein [Pontibacter saemangeumensis]|uniref:hypothetical protein n=1 Tax=Pontibacter saemangeumensis TaxID=1084525 RepID=UPI0031F01CA9